MDQNDKLAKFYKSIINEINQLVSQKQFQTALDRIDEELQCSYLPVKYEEKLQELIKHVRIQQYEDCSATIAKLPLVELLKHVLNEPVKNYDAYIFLLDKYSSKITEQQWRRLLAIFEDDQITNSVKFLFLLPLLEIKSAHQKKFSYYNRSTKKQTALVISAKLFAAYDDFTSDTFKIIDDEFFKEPSKQNLAEHLVDLLTTYFFPDFIPCDPQKLGNEIVNYVNNSFANESEQQAIDPSILALINLVVKAADSNQITC